MQNFLVVPRQTFHVLSNGVLGFLYVYVLCTGTCRKLLTETVLPINLHSQHIGLNLQENKVHHSKEH
jgi:hypothetical protein